MAAKSEYTRGRVHAYKHPDNGRWYVRFVHQNRREHFSLKVTRRTLAEKEADEINALLESGQWSKLRNRAKARHRTFSDVTTEYLEKGCRWSESTLKGCSSSLNRLLSEFGEQAVTDIDGGLIEAYIARRRDEGRSKGTRNRELAIVKAILKKAFEWGYVPYNAAADVTTEQQGKKTPQPYTRDELSRLLAELQPQHQNIATLYLHTALRRGELMKLMWADVDWEARTLTVRAPKNDDDRTIPLSNDVYGILRERRKDWERERRAGLLDLRVYGESADIRKVLDRAAVRAEIDEGRRHRLQHRLRDTCATTLLDAAVPLDRVQLILGHRDIGMTRRYAETRPEALREAIAATFDR